MNTSTIGLPARPPCPNLRLRLDLKEVSLPYKKLGCHWMCKSYTVPSNRLDPYDASKGKAFALRTQAQKSDQASSQNKNAVSTVVSWAVRPRAGEPRGRKVPGFTAPRKWPPDVLQHEVHPLQREEQLRRYCRLWNFGRFWGGTIVRRLVSRKAKERATRLLEMTEWSWPIMP